MTPIYFPFTYISQTAADALSEYFGKITVYQPSSGNIPESMQEQAEKGILDIRTPADEENLAGVIQEYKNWAQVHQGSKISFFKTQTDNIPFFEDSSSHKIRADILRKGVKKEPKKADPLLQAKIFLSIAQEFDIQHREVRSQLQSYADMENELLRDIKGSRDEIDTGLNPHQAVTEDEPGTHMTDERLNAWTRLVMSAPDFSGLFITTSVSVMETLKDIAGEYENVFEGGLPDGGQAGEWNKEFMGFVEELSRGDISENPSLSLPDSDEKNAFLTVYRINESPRQFFSRCLGKKAQETGIKNQDDAVKNTLIAFIEIK